MSPCIARFAIRYGKSNMAEFSNITFGGLRLMVRDCVRVGVWVRRPCPIRC